jgi:superfamily II DNA helicase RecQ
MIGDDKTEGGVKRKWTGSDEGNQSTRKATGKKVRQGRKAWNDGREMRTYDDTKRKGTHHYMQGKETTVRATADEIQHGLQKLIESSAAWKTKEQGEAMEKIMDMNGRESLIVILPTGGGKSVLPALIKGAGTSIVVIPFTALIDDLVDRAQKNGVDCIRWKPVS